MIKIKKNKNFNKITIKLSSPESILMESSGEVLKPETINYRTHKPERDGLFCEKIFGPVKDYECSCGKYKRIRYKGVICDRCGVEITEKKVRRNRIGHVSLVIPIVHIWYFKSLPNKIGYLLGMSSKDLDSIIYYEKYAVIQPGNAKYKNGKNVNKLDLLNEEEFISINKFIINNNSLDKENTNKFIAKTGAECVEYLLKDINLLKTYKNLKKNTKIDNSKQKRKDSLKRLKIIESFLKSECNNKNKREWMIIKVLPIIPPELRPLVPLDGGRFATSDLNDFYRRIIIRNNRLKRLIHIKAPEVILRNEKRMLQEAVDSLYDNTKKTSRNESSKILKSLSDSLKGKQGRFRQNLLGKRVDYSARSVIVVGPNLKLYECGLPKYIASELYKPFIIKKLIDKGISNTVKSAKKIIDNKDPIIWNILKNIIKGHPVLLNRAPTLHRLGIQAFQPKLIEGKAIQLPPLVCTAFNADFDGDQMAVHLPLSQESILEAQFLMLSSQNILNPANGNPITVPSQDMILGLYYMTKYVKSDKKKIIFSSYKEVQIAYNLNLINIHEGIKLQICFKKSKKIIETTTGRVLFNMVVPKNIKFINKLITKSLLQNIIKKVLIKTDVPTTVNFLDNIKDLGFNNAFKGGLSFNLEDIVTPKNKNKMINDSIKEIESIKENYNMGLITNNDRYNQTIDIWTNTNSIITDKVINNMKKDNNGLNPVYMMLDSGARSSKEQIRQLSGMRGLMAKPQKTNISSNEIIENPIISNFIEGLSILEYFISTHGSRKGLADTALKTADAGYLTRRLVDVAQDVIIKEYDCKTIKGIEISSLIKNEEIIDFLSNRISGRVSLYDVYNPINKELIVKSNDLINEKLSKIIEKSGIESIYVRSPLTCDSKIGICVKCYGINLSTGNIVNKGEAVGVTAAQSIGEPGTQLTLRTFHVGGTASNVLESYKIEAKYNGKIEFEDIKTIKIKDNKIKKTLVLSRYAEMKIINKNKEILMSNNIPYGSTLFVSSGSKVKRGDKICSWDPYNSVIITEFSGFAVYENIKKGSTYQVEFDEYSGFKEKIISESRDKKKIPIIKIINKKNKELISYSLPLGSNLIVKNKQKVKKGDILVKIPRKLGKTTDITGGLPRVTELCEARNPSNLGIVSEIDGIIYFGKKKRGSKEIIVKSKYGYKKKYLIKTSNQILVQENDYIKSGTQISEGAITPEDILNIKGPNSVQEYLVNEIQNVYRLQGVKINDKHFEIIVRQMMRKVKIIDSGDTKFIEGSIEHKNDFLEENNRIFNMRIIEKIGDSKKFNIGDMVNFVDIYNENYFLKIDKKKLVKSRKSIPSIAKPILQGITKSSLQTKSFISAASFQETTKVLNEAAINGKSDSLLGLKENVIVGHKIPAGTGLKEYQNFDVENKSIYEYIENKIYKKK